jgi:hypothetical protein
MEKKLGLSREVWKTSNVPKIIALLVLLFVILELSIYFIRFPSNQLATVISSGGVVVSMTSPTSCTSSCSTSYTSPSLHIVASASSTHPITGWHIYVDSADVYGVNNVSNIDTNVKVSPGQTVIVRAWDSTGTYGAVTLKVTIPIPTPIPGPVPIPTPIRPINPISPILPVSPVLPILKPSATSTLISNIEDASPWKTCGNCGNSGAVGATASYFMVQNITSPSLDGSAAQFTIGGDHAYSNAYWYINHPASTKLIKTLTYDFWLYVPAKFANTPQAIEFESEQHVNGLIYNYAWQADYGSKTWRVFNYTAKKWESSGITFALFAPDTWHHIVAEYHADGSVGYHDALSIDGVRHPVSISYPATPKSNLGNQFTNAFQLDLNGQKTPYSVYVDKMDISYTQ